LIYVGCPGQLTRTTTIPHDPLDILQAQEQVRHRGGDKRAHRGSNPGRWRNKSHGWPQQLDPQGLWIHNFNKLTSTWNLTCIYKYLILINIYDWVQFLFKIFLQKNIGTSYSSLEFDTCWRTFIELLYLIQQNFCRFQA